MNDVTSILSAIEQGKPEAADALLPLVDDELRRLAARRLAQVKPGQTLQATALVHEEYLRLVGPADAPKWEGRGHFFAAAAEAMRRILVENAHPKTAEIHGGGQRAAGHGAGGWCAGRCGCRRRRRPGSGARTWRRRIRTPGAGSAPGWSGARRS